MAAPAYFGEPVYDVDRLNAIFQAEISGYLRYLPADFISEKSARCGSLLGWFTVLAPEALSDNSKSKLYEACYKLRFRPGDVPLGWFQELPLKIAAYGLSRDPEHLRSHVENLSIGGSGWGWEIKDSLALVVHELDFEDYRLRSTVEAGLSHCGSCCEIHAAMILMAKGRKEAKIEVVNGWLNKYRLNSWERDYLEKLAAGECVRNPFVYPFFRQQTYIVDRLSHAEPVRSEPNEDGALFDMRPHVRLFERIKAHPMMQSHLQIKTT